MSTKYDEFSWGVYHNEYSKQIIEMREELDLFITRPITSRPLLNKEDENGLVFRDNLHNNWKDLYNLIYQLNPLSVYEVGCGSGQHLANIKTIMPHCMLYGCDISQKQLDFGRGKLGIRVDVFYDVTVDDFDVLNIEDMLGKYSVVYSHAVLMHVNANRAKNMLRKMLEISDKYVVLTERQHVHNYQTILHQIDIKTVMVQPSKYGTDLFLIEKI